jgi:hypothetical protein
LTYANRVAFATDTSFSAACFFFGASIVTYEQSV